jgi:hypothetical protein
MYHQTFLFYPTRSLATSSATKSPGSSRVGPVVTPDINIAAGRDKSPVYVRDTCVRHVHISKTSRFERRGANATHPLPFTDIFARFQYPAKRSIVFALGFCRKSNRVFRFFHIIIRTGNADQINDDTSCLYKQLHDSRPVGNSSITSA